MQTAPGSARRALDTMTPRLATEGFFVPRDTAADAPMPLAPEIRRLLATLARVAHRIASEEAGEQGRDA